MLVKVTDCEWHIWLIPNFISCVGVTRRWAISCTKCSQLVVLIHMRSRSSLNVEGLCEQLFFKNHCYIISDGNCPMYAYLSSVGVYAGFLERYHCLQLLKWFHQYSMGCCFCIWCVFRRIAIGDISVVPAWPDPSSLCELGRLAELSA